MFPNWELPYLFLVRVISKRVLRTFWIKHKNCEHQLKTWYREAEEANWKSIKDIKQDYASVRFLPGNRVVCNIKGNRYRLIIRVNYDYGIIWIRFIGTHSDNDKIDATKI